MSRFQIVFSCRNSSEPMGLKQTELGDEAVKQKEKGKLKEKRHSKKFFLAMICVGNSSETY